MENVIKNYETLLLDYSEASRIALETGRKRLLAFAMEKLEEFERSFIETFSFEELLELQVEFNSQGLQII
ncbi:hypothetical protein SRABI80_03110 [Peribacillus frigoritolerans]|uniref:hypothetical protein n=1 Tax=Peribacillus frigoritolerans TaxID=450367 RepID=UPI001D61E8E0|nr:hypothetical protein [Peribacillus frigoritolerans]CAH0256421.1 hypothetical protein SRABI80_03110 [Peribacillus frigoritolerans]